MLLLAQKDGLEDGKYSVSFRISKEKSEELSMAGGHLERVNYGIRDGKKYFIVTLNRTDWIKNLTAIVDGKEITPTVIEEIKNNNGEEISRIKFPINLLLEIKYIVIVFVDYII
ncbi:NEAT domain-containing protein [Clostridium sporogenes]|uniref:NEAT domain-containing protein n=1 Tax=Clostridium sporogenes TaxID=1509 RepID=UPI0023B7748F|nr:NEAT domain-containing protein [Clostridium sporogenes]